MRVYLHEKGSGERIEHKNEGSSQGNSKEERGIAKFPFKKPQ